MRIIFMGTPDFATGILQTIVEKKNDKVVAVVTMPDKPAGRGMKMQQSSVKTYALSQAIDILQPEKLRDSSFLQALRLYEADLFVVVAFRMLPEVVWKMPKLGTINLHASLLPQYRGAAPINWAIINGEKKTGLTTFLINEKIDQGAILLRQEVSIDAQEDAGTLHDKLMNCGKTLILETLKGIEEETIFPKEQISKENFEKTAPKIEKSDCQIDFTKTTAEVFNFIRGLSPYPAAYLYFLNNKNESVLMKIFSVSTVIEKHNLPTGIFESDGKNFLSLTCSDGRIFVQELQICGKKRMKIKDFLLGNKDFNGKKAQQ